MPTQENLDRAIDGIQAVRTQLQQVEAICLLIANTPARIDVLRHAANGAAFLAFDAGESLSLADTQLKATA